ncbi:MAG: hypothetical protein MJK08_08115 [Campylobacterales bacterium]|nr:hypothetical protein [Campylobacterales bacterium]
MIENRINKMLEIIQNMKNSILDDIEDIKKAKHENLLNRNEYKQKLIDDLESEKELLNSDLVQVVQNGEDLNLYKDMIDNLENELKELYSLNHKLARIVLPIQEMYKDLVSEILESSGGKIIDIKV